MFAIFKFLDVMMFIIKPLSQNPLFQHFYPVKFFIYFNGANIPIVSKANELSDCFSFN